MCFRVNVTASKSNDRECSPVNGFIVLCGVKPDFHYPS